jgi:hypothetical protein
MIETDAAAIVALLEKKTRASASDLGTDNKAMEALAEAGVAKKDGTIKTGRRGKPPAAWVLEEDRPQALPDLEAKRRKERRAQQIPKDDQIAVALAEIQRASSNYDGCKCVRTRTEPLTWEDLRFMSGCKDLWVCAALDTLRRKVLGY